MNKIAALIIAVGIVGFTALDAEAKHNRGGYYFNGYNGWNNCGKRNWNRDCGRSFNFRRVFNRNPYFRHDNGRHLGWYKNGGNRWW